jgi:NADH-quinone oxidoreductase subunit L
VLGQARIAENDFVAGTVGLAICLLLLLAACGKSAQFPLHVWLPDAMEGPTPVSALIHAATMVTAGVYMIARCTPLFMVSSEAQLMVACVGGFTALLAALIALTQFDLKRVLAYSTISQLGYMFLGLGAGTFGGITAGMFHLFTHAFFKALLFLGAGSVMHAMGNVIDMRRFGGLRKLMPITHATFFIGCLALAGLPPFAGFWSKDRILASIEEKAHELEHASAGDGHAAAAEHADGHTVAAADFPGEWSAKAYWLLYYAGLFTALLTAVYTFRALYMTFYGAERIPHEAGHHAHESPSIMTWPLIVLALGAALVGLSLDRAFVDFLAFTPSLAAGPVAATRLPYEFHFDVAAASIAVALIGVVLASYLYLGSSREVSWLQSVMDMESIPQWLDFQLATRMSDLPLVAGIHRAARRIGFGWLTAAIGHLFALLLLVLATPFLLANYLTPYRLSARKFFFDELYEWLVVHPTRWLAQLCYAIDRGVIDGTVNLIGRMPLALGSFMRSLQMGLIQFYALAMFLGVLVLIATKLMWAAP